MPYLLNAPFAALGAKLVLSWYVGIPEMKGKHPAYEMLIVDRGLEEIDEFFDSGVSSRRFKVYQTSGVVLKLL